VPFRFSIAFVVEKERARVFGRPKLITVRVSSSPSRRLAAALSSPFDLSQEGPVIGSNAKQPRKLPKSRALYAKRYLVECFFHRLKRFRAIATRFEKTARNFLALTHLACATLWLE